MKERFVIIIVAVIAGLFITTAGFFIYSATQKGIDDKTSKKTSNVPTPTPLEEGSLYVKISEPADESLADRRTLQIKGTTNPENVIIVTTNQEDIAAKPTSDGAFTVTVDIDAGANVILTRAIGPNGDEVTDRRVVTYSTDEF